MAWAVEESSRATWTEIPSVIIEIIFNVTLSLRVVEGSTYRPRNACSRNRRIPAWTG